jgi:hypothetical protein
MLFNIVNEVCNLVSIRVGPLYITSFSFFTLNSGFHILGALMGFNHSLSHLWLKFFMKIWG